PWTPTSSAGWPCRWATGATTPPCELSLIICGTNSSRPVAMRFKADEIVSVLETEIEQYRSQVEAREVGRVLEVGDGIARVYGLSGVMAGEMVDFKRTGVKGLAFNLE